MGLGGKPDPQSGSLALTTVLRICVDSSTWTGRSHLCGAARVGVLGTGMHPHKGLFANSIGVRKLVELLQGGLGKFACLTLSFLISEMGLLKDQQCFGKNTRDVTRA